MEVAPGGLVPRQVLGGQKVLPGRDQGEKSGLMIRRHCVARSKAVSNRYSTFLSNRFIDYIHLFDR